MIPPEPSTSPTDSGDRLPGIEKATRPRLRLSNSLLHNTAFMLALALVGMRAWQGQRTASAVLENNDQVRGSLELVSAIKEARSAMQDVISFCVSRAY